ncbi:WhiB family transcriptional regulator [Actinoalloteichus spitiensis]|uniref:WhiB family transcriptional regulator n=1 Tax=Actinoalloteichus spitiensis TaxID=252394 RepID=UPI00036C48FA|nr:WhiB family transcriptional regulator [Actinoalloteichus spitiensis]
MSTEPTPDLAATARRLTRLRRVPTNLLAELVRRDGACGHGSPAEPPHDLTERDYAAHLCAGCPVADPCLELELRSAGSDVVGVWGGLTEDDTRHVHRAWSKQDPDDHQGERR